MSCPSNTISKPLAPVSVFISLGSNLSSSRGSPRETVLAAMDLLAGWSVLPALRSSLWASDPVDCPPGSPEFVNAAIGIAPASDLTAYALLARLQTLESEFGRRRSGRRNEPRSLDLDLICFGDQCSADPRLTLPHPAAHLRGFVLMPLAEIAPDLRLPGQPRPVRDLAATLAETEPRVIKITG